MPADGQRPSQLIVSVVDGQGRAFRAPGLGRWLVGVAPARARGEVTVALVPDARVRALNRAYRGVDASTDVLSFPSGLQAPPFGLRTSDSRLRTSESRLRPSDSGLQTSDSRLQGPEAHGQRSAARSPRSAVRSPQSAVRSPQSVVRSPQSAVRSPQSDVFLGDIVIARGVARRQAAAEAHAESTEWRVLALHGLLHLLGYDHEADRGEMQRVEQRLRRKGGLARGLIERAPSRQRRTRGATR